MNYLGANMKLIVECSQKLVQLGENLWGKEQKLDNHIVKWSNGLFDKYYPEYNPENFGCMFLGLWGDEDNLMDEE